MEGDKQVVPACVCLEKNPVAEEGESSIAFGSSHICLSMSAQGRYSIALGDAVEGVRQALRHQGQDGHQAGGYRCLCVDILELSDLSNCSPRPGVLLVETGVLLVS